MKALYKKRLRRLADVIEIKHKLFNMSNWIDSDPYNPSQPDCGTTACLAGFAVAEFHPHKWEDYEDAFDKLIESDENVPDNGHISEAALKLLGLPNDKPFYHMDWPAEYGDAYREARDNENTKGMAKAAAKYLRAIASGKVTL